jgi:hypothetical protein
MRKVIYNLLESSVNNYKENFQLAGSSSNNLMGKSPILLIVSILLAEILVLFLGKWLWNNVVVHLVSSLKPAKSIWQILGLSILIKLITN